MPGHQATPIDDIVSHMSTPAVLACFWTYAATAGAAALLIGDTVADMASTLLPSALAKALTVGALVLLAGAAQESILTQVARRIRRS
jgi:hypothetical protein